MWARSTTVYGTPDTIEKGIDYVRDDVWPILQRMDGCLGLSMIVDHEAGTGIVTASWADEAALEASRMSVSPLRQRATEIMDLTTPPVVAEWEIASMHRAHHAEQGTCVRVAWSHVPIDTTDVAIDWYRSSLLPQIEQLEGFVSASLMVDRAKGAGVTSIAFESREAMIATRDQADYLRGRSTQEANAEFLDVAEFELVMAHLHVPEVV